MNNISVKKINDFIRDNKWEGKPDPTALMERLRDLLEAEEDLRCLTKEIKLVRKFFSQG